MTDRRPSSEPQKLSSWFVELIIPLILSKAKVDSVKHIVEAEPHEHSYQNLKESLVASHVMSDYEKVDKLVNMMPLNGRKPADLLVEMEKLNPSDEKQFFAYLFLQRMPSEVRALLTGKPVNNMRALAEKADAFMVLHKPQSQEEETVKG
jgi:hypothetical protein